MPKIIEQEQSIHLLAQTEKRKEAILGCMGSFFPITGSSQHARQFPKYSKSETSVLPWTSGSVFWLVEIAVAKLKAHKVQSGYMALTGCICLLHDSPSFLTHRASAALCAQLWLSPPCQSSWSQFYVIKINVSLMWLWFWLVIFNFLLFLRSSCWYSKNEVAIFASFLELHPSLISL